MSFTYNNQNNSAQYGGPSAPVFNKQYSDVDQPPPYSSNNSMPSHTIPPMQHPLSSLSTPYQAPSMSVPQGGPADQNREQRFIDILSRYEISRDFSNRLQKYLVMTKIVFVYDDSGSMNSVLNDSPLNTGVFKATRWDELKNFSKISIDLANIFNPEGIDIHFLNRPAARNVRTLNDLEPYLVNKPSGFTPMRRTLETVLRENNVRSLAERKLLIVIVTDGEPTDDSGREDINGFKYVLESRNKNVYTTIVSCTDEDNTMDYLNNWDRIIPRLDVVDDYRNEKAEILKAKGPRFPFSYGDYIVKTLIGSMDPELDNLDETGNRNLATSSQNDDCCIIL
jgi:hypothetical protein